MKNAKSALFLNACRFFHYKYTRFNGQYGINQKLLLYYQEYPFFNLHVSTEIDY
jgi:hypothetical protein